MGSDDTATATTGGPRIIAYLTGTGRHRAQIILQYTRAALRARETMASDDDDEISREELAKALGCTVEELDG